MPIRLLIADDNPVVRTALHQLLERAGDWEVVDAENGREAIARAQEFAPNLIILDLVMPVMDGLAAAREISKLMPQTPLLMHTLHWSPQVEIEAQKVGVRKVVPKADSKGLISAIRHYLNLNVEPQAVVAATPEGVPSVMPSSVSSGSDTPSNVATLDVTALPPLLDRDAEANKANEAGTGSASEKHEMPAETSAESNNVPSQRPTT
jgi:DNA-binding NarL/FixJ family response regulator